MHILDYLILIAVAVSIFLAISYIRKPKKHGCGGCDACSSCKDCASYDSCNRDDKS